MFDIQMTTKENFAHFSDKETGKSVFVDSFDNRDFEVRFGTAAKSKFLGTVTANTDQELTQKLNDLVKVALQ